MRFRTLEISRTVATVIGAAAAVMAALAGWGPWAIIVQTLCTYGASTVLMWTLSPWRPTWAFSRDSFRSLGAFGAKTSLSRLLLYTNLNADNLLIGRYLGAASLGIYAVAYNVMTLPLSRAIMALPDVLYPALARLQDDPRRLGETWLRVNRMASGLIAPALLGLAAVAPDFVHVVSVSDGTGRSRCSSFSVVPVSPTASRRSTRTSTRLAAVLGASFASCSFLPPSP
jgi:O-antigen/teichoic acid export membrane protein